MAVYQITILESNGKLENHTKVVPTLNDALTQLGCFNVVEAREVCKENEPYKTIHYHLPDLFYKIAELGYVGAQLAGDTDSDGEDKKYMSNLHMRLYALIETIEKWTKESKNLVDVLHDFVNNQHCL